MYPDNSSSFTPLVRPSDFNINKIETLSDFECLAETWERLFQGDTSANAFVTFHWLCAWWEAYGSSHKMYVLVIERDSVAIGIAPLMITESRRAGKVRKTVEFIGTPNADYSDFIGCDRQAIVTETMAYLKGHADDWDEIHLGQIPERSDSVVYLIDYLRVSGDKHLVRPVEECPAYVYRGDDEDRSSFVLKRDAKLRQSLNFLKRCGDVSVDFYTDTDEITALLPDFFHSHIVRWGGTNTPSKFLRPKNRRFYERLVARLAPEGLLSMTVLRLGGRPIGYLTSFNHDRTVYLYTLSYSQFYRRKSPGKLILHALIEHCVRLGYDIIDFTRGGESYKAEYCTDTSRNIGISVYQGKLPYTLAVTIENIKKSKAYQVAVHNWGLSELKARLAGKLSPSGIKDAIKVMGTTAIDRVAGYCAVSIYSDSSASGMLSGRLKGVEVRSLNPNDIDSIGTFLGFEAGSVHHQELQSRFTNGSGYFGAFHKNGLVGLSWVLAGERMDDKIAQCVKPGNDEVVIMGTVISPVFEKPEMHDVIHSAIKDHYQPQNRRVLLFCDKQNGHDADAISGDSFKHQATNKCLKPLGVGSCEHDLVCRHDW